MAAISLRGVGKSYEDGAWAVRDVDLHVQEGELLVLLGPSGCGKTTLLRLVAGLERLSRGEILVGGRVVNDLAPAERDVAMIFQSYALYPHKTVRQNLSFPLRMRGVGRAERRRRIEHVARVLDLEPLLDRRPGQLSGGQQQRVAIGRALVRQPAAFLMDEPLSNLDAQLRTRIRAELAALQRRLGITTLFVTHDQTEAMTLGHRVAVLREGRLQQVGTPDELYRRPANLFVAWFVGQPAMNLVQAKLGRHPDGADGPEAHRGTVPVRPLRTDEEEGVADRRKRAARQPPEEEREVTIGVRPEALRLVAAGSDDRLAEGSVVAVEALGPERLVHVETGLASGAPGAEGRPSTLVVRVPAHLPAPKLDERVGLAAAGDVLHVFGPDGRALRSPVGV